MILSRRDFVKGVVAGAGATAAAGALGYGALRGARAPPPGPRTVWYVGARAVGGPPVRAVPVVPLRVREDRVLEGIPAHLAWYRSCGREGAPGLSPDYGGDNVLRYFVAPDRVEQGYNPWYAEKVGEAVRVEDSPEEGFGAVASWRSEGAEGASVLLAVVIRLGEGFWQETFAEKLPGDEGHPLGFAAYDAACTHFCCVCDWKADEKMQKAREAWEHVYCSCHDGQFDPRQPVDDAFLTGSP